MRSVSKLTFRQWADMSASASLSPYKRNVTLCAGRCLYAKAWLTCLHARVSQLLRLNWRRHAHESWAAVLCSLPATEYVTSQTMSLHDFGVSVVCQCWQMVADASDTCEGSVKAHSAP